MGTMHHAAVCCPPHLQVRVGMGPEGPTKARRTEGWGGIDILLPPLSPYSQVGSLPSLSSVCGARAVVKICPSQAPIIVGATQAPAGRR